MIAKALHYKAQGYKAIKMQVAHADNLRGDVDNVRRMREALGPDVDIMIDVNQGWTADVAIQVGRKIEPYEIYWLEEPVPADDFKGYLRVAEALPILQAGDFAGMPGLPLNLSEEYNFGVLKVLEP
jgi:L-alanine-DL-glutamate epimerase-like enolase superfamily enzyme